MKPPNIKNWHYYKTKTLVDIEGVVYPFLSAKFYEKKINDEEWTCGIYSHQDTPILMAWGRRKDRHCSFNAVYRDGRWQNIISGCPVHEPISNRQGKVIGIRLQMSDYIFEYDSAHKFEHSNNAQDPTKC